MSMCGMCNDIKQRMVACCICYVHIQEVLTEAICMPQRATESASALRNNIWYYSSTQWHRNGLWLTTTRRQSSYATSVGLALCSMYIQNLQSKSAARWWAWTKRHCINKPWRKVQISMLTTTQDTTACCKLNCTSTAKVSRILQYKCLHHHVELASPHRVGKVSELPTGSINHGPRTTGTDWTGLAGFDSIWKTCPQPFWGGECLQL